MIAKATVTVTEYQLKQRINYRLRRDGYQRLRVARGARVAQVGRYFLVDVKTGAIIRHHVDLEKLARKLSMLHAWEVLEMEP